MKFKKIIIGIIFLLLVISGIAIMRINNINLEELSYVEVNDVLMTVKENWRGELESILKRKYDFEYIIFDDKEEILLKSSENCPNSLKEAVELKCISLPIIIDEEYKGNLVINNNSAVKLKQYKEVFMGYIFLLVILSSALIVCYSYYLDIKIIKPFNKLRSFAENIASGNLEVPLDMDRDNIFGAFTESFDIMREELYIARENEKKANESKKELVVSLSHDIKTPLSSIKAMSEVMMVKEDDENKNKKLNSIWNKANIIELLINNLFHATLEELRELKVESKEEESSLIKNLVNESDYNHLVEICNIPDCIIICDKLRMQQVIDNIIGNSYKYANTKICVHAEIEDEYLKIDIRDYGPGVGADELVKITEKYYRGKETQGKNGSGVGLYLANYFMDNMQGGLEFSNDNPGLKASVYLRLA